MPAPAADTDLADRGSPMADRGSPMADRLPAVGDTTDAAALAADPSPTVRAAVAATPHTPAAALASLAVDPVDAVVEAVLRRDVLPVEALDALAGARVSAARAAATFPGAGRTALLALASHDAASVRAALVRRANPDAELLAAVWERTAEDWPSPDSEMVALALLSRPSTPVVVASSMPASLVWHHRPDLVEAAAGDGDLAELVAALAPTFDGTVGELVAAAAAVLDQRT